jgi:hypothetical protein
VLLAVGVPLKTPAEVRVNPGGSDAGEAVQV